MSGCKSSNGPLPPAANDNPRPKRGEPSIVEVLIPKNLPILQVEVEVIATLLDDWPVANDNEKI
jgi:hypothetical protein